MKVASTSIDECKSHLYVGLAVGTYCHLAFQSNFRQLKLHSPLHFSAFFGILFAFL